MKMKNDRIHASMNCHAHSRWIIVATPFHLGSPRVVCGSRFSRIFGCYLPSSVVLMTMDVVPACGARSKI